jgi:Helix-turn-helix domain
MRGRKPAGPQYVDGLAGSAQAKERLQVVLETLAGTCRVQQACQRLGVGQSRFHALRQQALAAALAGLEPRPAGRPATWAPPLATEVAALQAQVAELEVAVRAAQTREEIALVLPRVAGAPAEEKKTRRRGSRRDRPRRRAAGSGTESDI